MKAARRPTSITRWPRLRDPGRTHKKLTTAWRATRDTLHRATSSSIKHRSLHKHGIWSIRHHTLDRDYQPDLPRLIRPIPVTRPQVRTLRMAMPSQWSCTACRFLLA